jgi:hypothetical protein
MEVQESLQEELVRVLEKIYRTKPEEPCRVCARKADTYYIHFNAFGYPRLIPLCLRDLTRVEEVMTKILEAAEKIVEIFQRA